MLSHVTVGSTDLERSGAFYDAFLAPLGLRRRNVRDLDGNKLHAVFRGDLHVLLG